MTTLGIWAPQGVVIPSVSGDSPQQPAVIYEGNAQILSGTVFKCWFGNNGNLCYAESSNGTSFTRHSGSNGVVLASVYYPHITKQGSTYYCYGSPSTDFTTISAWTSPDGVTWTLAKTGTLTAGPALWDGHGVFQINVLGVISGTWYAYYAGQNSSLVYGAGLITSSDGLNWTKSVNNPIIPGLPANLTTIQIGSTWFGWSQVAPSGIPGENTAQPSDISRFSATNPSGPWTALGSNTIYRTDFQSGVNVATGQIADPSIVFDGTNTWMFCDSDNTGTASSSVIVTYLAANTTPAQLVQTYEGVQNYPIPNSLSLQLVQQAQETFSGTQALGSEWTPVNTGVTNTVKNGLATGSTTSTQAGSYYNLLGSLGAQWAQVTVGAYVASEGFVGATVMNQSGGNGYRYNGLWKPTGGTSGTWYIQKVTAGPTYTICTIPGGSGQDATGTGWTVNVGDTITLCAIPVGGTTYLSLYWNNVLICTATDTSYSSGYPGMFVDPLSSSPSLEANAGLSAFACGSLQNAPPIPSSSTSAPWYLDQVPQLDVIKRHRGF